MAELVLSTIGQAVGGRVLGTAGAALGRIGGAYLGRGIDQHVFGASRQYEGPRLTDLHLQGSTEGASIPAVFGSVRLAGQVIWAARFKEHVDIEEVGGGKGGGPRVTRRDYRYSLSFAVGLCEGEVTRIGRVWANGEPLDLSAYTWRLHAGSETQMPDALIESIEGNEHAPAYRGLAYVVFEDMPLDAFGNAIPQLSFEIVRAAGGDGVALRDLVKGVCLIPGAGEFVYAAEPVLRSVGPGAEVAENVHMERERANLLVSLDQLQADLPNCETVALVVAWFGDDLRCGVCQIRPGVEIAEKETAPLTWRAGGVDRAGAHVVSTHDGAPAYGGTPSDACVLQAIAELKSRGYKVALYPFLLMDVPAGNGRSDPYGGEEQAPYPWRGRISVHPAPGEAGSPDKTSAAALQVAAFFGAAAPAHFGSESGAPNYVGPEEWSYRRFILHYAKLAALAGGVDAFILGSEMRGLTTSRDSAATYPAVTALRDLAEDVRTLTGMETKLTYAADWSEYFGHHPQDGSGDVFFHLDPLWSDPNIDAIGIDWYPPLSDWRAGVTHLDAQSASSIHDIAYLQSRIEGGEDYDWRYAGVEERAQQTRSVITDGAYDEAWIYRAKDVRNFWSNEHHHRPGGVRSSTPTEWVPQSKPIWFVELGCPAVDKGSNTPNLFSDAKSSESALPHYSTGARDDLVQRRTLAAYMDYWALEGARNPVSALTGKAMIEAIWAWCWDARPHPAFPARDEVWADGAAWRRGHWLNGRAGLSELGEVVEALCARAGMTDVDAARLRGAVSGYVADAPAPVRALLEPLMIAFDFDVAEREGALVFFHHGDAPDAAITLDELAAESSAALFAERADAAEAPVEARVRFLDGERDYRVASVSARRLDAAEGGVESIDAPLVLDVESAEAMAQCMLVDARARNETLRIALDPAQLAFEPGDRITLGAAPDSFEVVRIEDAAVRALELRRARTGAAASVGLAEAKAPPQPPLASKPELCVLDLPLLPGMEADERPLAALFADPWLGAHEIYAGASATPRARVTQPAIMGKLLWPLWPGPVNRWDEGNVVRVTLFGGALSSAESGAVLAGANVFAIESDGGEWEIIQARSCVLVGVGEYELSGFLRGQLGSAHAMRAPHPAGARIVKVDERLARLDVGAHEWREPLTLVAPPAGASANAPRAASATVTLPHAASRCWAPAHVKAVRAGGGDVAVSWIRCAPAGGDAWGPGEPPLGASAERYQLEVLNGGGSVLRSVTVPEPAFSYSFADQIADFGAAPSSLRLRIAQIDNAGLTGLNNELTITL